MQPPNASPHVYPVTLAIPVVQGFDPTLIGQIAQLAVQAVTAGMAQQWSVAVALGLQIATLIAQALMNSASATAQFFTPAPFVGATSTP